MAVVLKIILGALLCYIALCAFLYAMQRSFIYYPATEFPVLPDTKGAGFIRVPTADGLTLIGWYSPARDGQKTILYFHGNAGGIGDRLLLMEAYLQKGYGVLMAEYRGYSGNPGSPSEQGLYDDGRAYLSYLTQEKEIAPKDLVLYGESIGSGVAVELARAQADLAALLLITPVSSFADIARRHYPYVPVDWLLKDRFDNQAKISEIKVPLFFFFAGRDEIVDPIYGERLYQAAGINKKRHDFAEASHNTLPIDQLNKTVLEVLDALP